MTDYMFDYEPQLIRALENIQNHQQTLTFNRLNSLSSLTDQDKAIVRARWMNKRQEFFKTIEQTLKAMSSESLGKLATDKEFYDSTFKQTRNSSLVFIMDDIQNEEMERILFD